MRLHALWLIACSCYHPASVAPCSVTCTLDCPSGLTCIDGLCRRGDGSCDGADDARNMIDMSIDVSASQCVLPIFTREMMYMPGLSYATGGTKAVYQATVTESDIWQTAIDTPMAGARID